MKTFMMYAFFLCVAFISKPLYGQNFGTSFIVHGGLTVAKISDVGPNDKARIGRNFGLGVDFPMSHNSGLRLGVGHVQKGLRPSATVTFDIGDLGLTVSDINDTYSFNMSYIEMTALGRLNAYNSLGGVKLHFLTGPTMALLTTCDISGLPLFGDVECDELVKKRDVGIAIGAGVAIPVSNSVFVSADFVHVLGLEIIADEDSADAESGQAGRNRALNLWLGVALELNR